MRQSSRKARPWKRVVAGAALALSMAVVGGGAAGAEVRNPKGVAAIIGNANYRHERVPEVSYAHRDADAFRHYVVNVLGYDPENVIDLRDADQATLESVFGNERSHEGKLWRYLDLEGGSDVVVFYSGHGVPGLKDKQSYLLPVNADPDTAEINGYPLNVLYRNLSMLKEARSVRVFVDACFSGDSDRGMLVRSASPVFVKAELPEARAKLTVVTAASGQQLASWDEKVRHGLFTHHLLDALYGKGDRDGDGKVTAAEAKRYLDRHMTRAARRTYGRHQRATLAGDGAVVLASAVKGSFVARPPVEPGGQVRVAPPASTPADGANPVPGHVEAERALGLDRSARVLIQRGLASLKFDAGPPDGLFGEKTRRAVRAWQEAKGFEATGHLTSEQAEALEAAGKEIKVAVGVLKPAKPAVKVREAGDVFRDCAECPEMVVIPAGSFRMGSSGDEKGRDGDEGPTRWVRVREMLAVGKYEVTVEEFQGFVGETGHDMSGGCRVYEEREKKWKTRTDRSWEDPGFRQTLREPVVCVSWEDAKSYVSWLSEKTGRGYRLLSEAEWEYAARAGTATRRYWGDDTDERGVCKNANGAGAETSFDWRNEWCGDGYSNTSPVGRFRANDWGLHDVIGNAWEWVEDCWHENYNSAPREGEAWVSGGDCSKRVLRGGSWYLDPRFLRSANRLRNSAGNRLNSSTGSG